MLGVDSAVTAQDCDVKTTCFYSQISTQHSSLIIQEWELKFTGWKVENRKIEMKEVCSVSPAVGSCQKNLLHFEI